VAKVIVAASNPAAGTHVAIYAPRFWRVVMFVIRNVPARIFHKTNL
jgi:decaprenylphospho-beta-D-erythro-pentofuranosid-2-ulose 2-reductase